jgi:nucleotide-binding universal stress UspA family protein
MSASPSRSSDEMIVVCYDGSADARAAVEQAGKLLGGQPAIVLTVWEPFIDVLARASFGAAMSTGMVDFEEIDAANRAGAEARAEEGAELARRAGLDAQPRTRSQVTTTAAAILEEASDLDATAIVVGSRGLTGVKSLVLGSVSHGLIHHADRTVIVVPSAEVASARATSLAT